MDISSKKKHHEKLKTTAYQANHNQFDKVYKIEHTKYKLYVVSVTDVLIPEK